MTLKDKLPDRLKCSPLLTMESDSDIETIAESIVNLSDSDGDFFKKTEKLLLISAHFFLGMSLSEIAKSENSAPSSVHEGIQRGLRRLKKILEEI